MKKALVTGGAGFIGNHLVRYLKDKGYWVRAVDIRRPPFADSVADDQFWNCDLRYGRNAMRAMQGVGFDEVYALAASMGGAGFVFSGRNDLEIATSNARINLNTLAAADWAGVKQYLFTSSACVYPEHLQMRTDAAPLKESDVYPAEPGSAYGWEKLFTERLCIVYSLATTMDVHIARQHNIYGPQCAWNDGREKAPAALCRKVAEAKLSGNHEIEMWGDGQTIRSFCYIDDLVEMLWRLMQSGHCQALNIGSDRAVSINQTLALITEIAGMDEVRVAHISGPQGPRCRNADLTKMKQVLNYTPRVSLEVGLACLYGWIEAQVKRAR